MLAALCVAACSSAPKPVYLDETFDSETPFQHHLEMKPATLCERGKRALLSQGYQVDTLSPLNLRGSKFFQPLSEHQVQLRINLACLESADGATLYANALQTRFELQSDGGSTGVSVAGVGSISLPWPASKGSLIKVSEETISDPEFYRRLFVLIELQPE